MDSKMLWSGRFEAPPHPEMLRLTRSTAIDLALLPYELRVARAHARSLSGAGLLDPTQVAAIDGACDDLLRDYSCGASVVRDTDEDVHSVVERELTARVGEVGARIHAGRSRNDLVVTDLRLWCKDAAADLLGRVLGLIAVLVRRAEEHRNTVMPGYTHVQRAQSVSLGFHLVAHAFALARDARRVQAAGEAADVSALGAGALAGTTLPIDPAVAARELGFGSVFENAMDAVSDRDFACDLVYAASLCCVHLSRLAEDVVLWTSSEFAFARLPDEWSTGSSMMPHKRNPDPAELVRGRAAGAVADLTGMLTLLKGLPLSYNRDLQEDKSFVFGAVERARGVVDAMTFIVAELDFERGRLESAAAESSGWATDLAELLVSRGTAFRDAHETVGALVARLEADGKSFEDLSDDERRAQDPRLGDIEPGFASPRASVAARARRGGTAPAEVERQIESLRTIVKELEASLAGNTGANRGSG